MIDWRIWASFTLIQIALPIPFLARDQVETRFLWRYPFVAAIAMLWLPVQALSRLNPTSWFHTPHGEDSLT